VAEDTDFCRTCRHVVFVDGVVGAKIVLGIGDTRMHPDRPQRECGNRNHLGNAPGKASRFPGVFEHSLTPDP